MISTLGRRKAALTRKTIARNLFPTHELEETVRKAFRLWLRLDHPRYSDKKDPDLFLESGPLYYARKGCGFARALNASRNSHKANRAERGAYRSRLREGTIPKADEKERYMFQAREFNMVHLRLRGSLWGEDRSGASPSSWAQAAHKNLRK